jgi:predicted glutamine amidotransferase
MEALKTFVHVPALRVSCHSPHQAQCTLVHAQNALLLQSRVDSRGEANAGGWGIAYYPDGEPEVERRDRAALEDIFFSTTAQRIFAKTVLAHIRKATIGSVALVNTHPLVFGP